MAKEQIFDFPEIISLVAEYFRRKGFQEVQEDYIHRGMKVHIHGTKTEERVIKSRKEKHEIEVIVEVTVSEEIPLLLIGENLGLYNEKVGVLTHFQIYFHPSKIYLAIPYYAINISKIEKLCEWEGIGLLRVNKDRKVKELLPALNRVELFRDVVNEEVGILDNEKRKEIIDRVKKVADHLLVHRAVRTLSASAPSYQMNLSRNLLQKMASLSDRVIYKGDILDFCNEYLTHRLDDYNIVLKWVKKLWNKYLPFPKTASSFDFYRDFENILKLDREYRDHFLHQFQVLLLGTFIIDKTLDRFREYYIKPFGELGEEIVFKSWLIASTFHDFAYPIERYGKWNDELFERLLNMKKSPTIIGLQKIITERGFLEYLDQIDSFLSCCKVSGDNWCYGQPHAVNQDLRRFLLNKIIIEKNHAVLSSLALLKKTQSEDMSNTQESLPEIFSVEICPAAVAIAIHDEGIWQPFRGKRPSWRKDSCEWEEEFSKSNYLNHLDFCDQPLSFLLIFCDTAQEFGRPKHPYLADEFVQKPQFKDVSVDKDKIRIIISVLTNQAYGKKEKELNETIDFLKCSQPEFVFRLENKQDRTGRDFPVTS